MKHKHADLIIAWANGDDIEFYSDFDSAWLYTKSPEWNDNTEYRIRPKEDKYQVFRDALKEGKEIQVNKVDLGWVDLSNQLFNSPPESYRIKPEPEYVPFTWEDREQLRGKWIKHKTLLHEELINRIHNNDKHILINGNFPKILLSSYTFLDGTPCGKLKKQ